MRFLSFGVIATMLLFAVDLFGQESFKEQLKSVEIAVTSIKNDTIAFTFDQLKSENTFDSFAVKTFQTLDSVIVFVNNKMQDKTATFDEDIILFLEVKSKELDLKGLAFSEEEKLVYDSFLNVLQWDKTIETVKLYESLLVKKGVETEALLIVLSFIKHTYFYIKNSDKIYPQSSVYQCIALNFESNNEVDWKVFALNPLRLIFWTAAACAWDAKSGK